MIKLKKSKLYKVKILMYLMQIWIYTRYDVHKMLIGGRLVEMHKSKGRGSKKITHHWFI